jgi:hypothetical protein
MAARPIVTLNSRAATSLTPKEKTPESRNCTSSGWARKMAKNLA